MIQQKNWLNSQRKVTKQSSIVQPGPAFSTPSGSHLSTCPSQVPKVQLAVCQNLVPLVNIKIAGKWMFIPLKMVLIGIDPYPTEDYDPSAIFGGPILTWAHFIEPLPSCNCRQTQCWTQHILTQLISFALVHDLLVGGFG